MTARAIDLAPSAGVRRAAAGQTYARHASGLFLRWNDVLAERYFTPARAGEPVWLSVSDALLADVAEEVGSSRHQFFTVLQDGPPWLDGRRSLCANALAAADGWRARRFPYPPYLGYLCLFALAAATETGDRANAYYPRLWQLLGERSRRSPPASFQHTTELWADLEKWSVQDEAGALGIFRAVPAGGHRHVGLPIAQQVLSPVERGQLPGLLADAGLPGQPPPDPEQLACALLRHAGRRLEPRTQALLRGPANPERAALLQQVLDALLGWAARPPVPAKIAAGPRGPARARPALRLCLRLDRAAGTAAATLRLRVPVIPDPPPRLAAASGLLDCPPAAPGWSGPLSAAGKPADAARLGDWLAGFTLADDRTGDRYHLPPAAVRALAQEPQLPGVVELDDLSVPAVLLLAHESVLGEVQAWAEAQGGALRRVRVSGLQHGWVLVEPPAAPDSSGLAGLLPARPGRRGTTLQPRGGLRVQPGTHRFFAFAPPDLELRPAAPGAAVYAGEKLLEPCAEGVFALPPGLRGLVQLTAWDGGELLAGGEVELSDGLGWAEYPPARRERATCRALPRDPLLSPGAQRGPGDTQLLLGRTPGQVTAADHDPPWQPVWLLRPGYPPAYCGGGHPRQDEPTGMTDSDIAAYRRWRQLLGNSAQPPPDGPHAVRALWQSYVRAARNAA